MKNIFIIVIALCFVLFSSCSEDFLEKAPGTDLTEDDAFLDQRRLDLFLASAYKYGVHSTFRHRQYVSDGAGAVIPFSGNGTNGALVIQPSTVMTDEAESSEQPTASSQTWNAAGITPFNIITQEDLKYNVRWLSMRQINLIIQRVNEVPDATDDYKKQVVAEVKFLRALQYMEMLKRYGGVPIVDKVFEAAEVINIPRASFEDCVKFILKDVDEAIAILPARQSASLTGRATSVAAAALKSEVLLYAASPQYNTATPVLPMANTANNNLICYGNFDNNRWKLAADAAKDAITLAESNGYGLITEFSKNPLDLNNGTRGPDGNYRYSCEINDNKELIMTYQGGATNTGTRLTNKDNAPLTFILPRCFNGSWGGGMTVPLNFIRKYENRLTGAPQTWDVAGGADVIAKFNELDPRFKQTVAYTNSYVSPRDTKAQIFNLKDAAGKVIPGGKDAVACLGGVWMMKYVPRQDFGTSFVINDPIFRVNELYLNAAEAINEFEGPVADAYRYVNAIRDRSGMPPLPAGLTKEQFRERVRNEIAIEMVNDDHRFWDVKRWLIAEEEGVMKGDMKGLRIIRTGTSDANYKYAWEVYTFETRVFNKNMYLHPFPQNEVNKGNLIQNPGW